MGLRGAGEVRELRGTAGRHGVSIRGRRGRRGVIADGRVPSSAGGSCAGPRPRAPRSLQKGTHKQRVVSKPSVVNSIGNCCDSNVLTLLLAKAEVAEGGADVDGDGALERAVGGVGGDGVGLAEGGVGVLGGGDGRGDVVVDGCVDVQAGDVERGGVDGGRLDWRAAVGADGHVFCVGVRVFVFVLYLGS